MWNRSLFVISKEIKFKDDNIIYFCGILMYLNSRYDYKIEIFTSARDNKEIIFNDSVFLESNEISIKKINNRFLDTKKGSIVKSIINNIFKDIKKMEKSEILDIIDVRNHVMYDLIAVPFEDEFYDVEEKDNLEYSIISRKMNLKKFLKFFYMKELPRDIFKFNDKMLDFIAIKTENIFPKEWYALNYNEKLELRPFENCRLVIEDNIKDFMQYLKNEYRKVLKYYSFKARKEGFLENSLNFVISANKDFYSSEKLVFVDTLTCVDSTIRYKIYEDMKKEYNIKSYKIFGESNGFEIIVIEV